MCCYRRVKRIRRTTFGNSSRQVRESFDVRDYGGCNRHIHARAQNHGRKRVPHQRDEEPVSHGRDELIDTKYHHIRDCGEVKLECRKTSMMLDTKVRTSTTTPQELDDGSWHTCVFASRDHR